MHQAVQSTPAQPAHRLATLAAAAVAAIALTALAAPAAAQSIGNVAFVNGLVLDGGATDLSSGSSFDRRIGYFSDIYYDAQRGDWWGLSDRGPGGGTLSYDTRMQRFTLDINPSTGAISNFQVVQTVKFTNAGVPMNGLAPSPSSTLGNSFDPEGLVVNPVSGNVLVSDEYGPSLVEFNRAGELVRRYTVPDNLVPKVSGTVDYNAAPPALTSGREGNRGFEGLAISPDGKFAYAMLQNGAVQDGYNNSTGNRGLYTRIVKFDTSTGLAVGQYAYKLDSSGQGRGISALVALGNDKFMVLERNNRGIGVGATLATADKNVFTVDLTGATDVSGIALSDTLQAGVVAASKGPKVIDLDANTLAALGNKSPEKWEGLAVGPRLANGKYLVLAGTDNDYSVTQNGTGTQFDVYFRFTDADPFASSIECPVGTTSGCFLTSNNATAATLTSDHRLLPGVLHAYTADIAGYVTPVPEPQSVALMLAGLLAVGAAAKRRR